MKTLLTLLLFSVSAFTCLAADDTATLKALLTKQSNDWDAAICRKDKPAIAANMGEGFRYIDSRGAVSDGAAFMAGLLDLNQTINPYTVDDLDIRIYGEIALLSGTIDMSGTSDGQPFKSHFRYIDIYNLQKGRWVVVNIQITRFPK